MWHNSKVYPSELPQLLDGDYTRINSRYLIIALVWRIILIIILSTLISSTLSSITQIPDIPPYTFPIFFGCFGVFCVLLLLFGYQSVENQGYLLREKDISYKKGWITQRYTSIPYNRIQHVEVAQGLLERWLDLARVKIYTAGGSSSDIQVPGLNLNTANSIKEYLLTQISTKLPQNEEE